MLTREQVLSLADQADSGAVFTSLIDAADDELCEFARLVWNAAIEEAAKKCERISDDYQKTEGNKWPELKSDAQTGASECEYHIRQLKEEE